MKRNKLLASFVVLFLAVSTGYTAFEDAFFSAYKTSFETPQYSEGPLDSQAGWEFSFGTDPVVTSAFARTGNQSLVVSGSDAIFGQNSLTGPFFTSTPQISARYSVYLDELADWSDTFITFGLSGASGSFLGQVAIRNGSDAVLRPADEDLFPTTIELGEWIDLELVFDFASQTQETFVDGESIGSAAFPSPATEVSVGQLFFVNFSGRDITFYVDDVSVTPVDPRYRPR